MAFDIPKSVGNYVTFDSPTLSGLDAATVTYFCWFRYHARSANSTPIFFMLVDTIAGIAGDVFGLIRGSGGNYQIRLRSSYSGTNGVWVTTPVHASSTTAWHSVSLTFDKSSDSSVPIVRFDGVNEGVTETGNSSGSRQTGLDVVRIAQVATSDSWNGDIANVCIWNVILSVAEVDALHAGVHPSDIRPANLRFHAPCLGIDPEPELTGQGTTGVHTGSVTTTIQNPPIARPRFNIWSAIRQAGGTLNLKTVTGALTFIGSVSRLTSVTRSGALTFIGLINRLTSVTRTGALAFIGLITKLIDVPARVAGVLTFTGILTSIKIVLKSVGGAITFVGDLTRLTSVTRTGALTFIGLLNKLTDIPGKTAGALTFAGGVFKRTITSRVAGAITFIGDLATTKVVLKAVGGAITFAGDVTQKAISKGVAGVLTFVGTLTRTVAFVRLVGGALTFIGSVVKFIDIPGRTAGALTFVGGIVRQTKKLVVGAFTFIGDLVTQFISPGEEFFQDAGGALTFSGALTSIKTFVQLVGGALTFVGGLVKSTLKQIVGALTFIGTITRTIAFVRLVGGALTFVGTITRSISVSISGALTFVGNAFKKQFKFVSGAISFLGSVSPTLNVGVPSMAVMLGELPVKGILAYLQSDLTAELAKIVTERGDSLPLPSVTEWFGYERPEPQPDKVEVEVYSEQDLSFPEFDVLTSQYEFATVTHLHSLLSIKIRLTHANRDSVSRGAMQERNWRYLSALARLFRNDPTVGFDDGTVLVDLDAGNDQIDVGNQLGIGRVTLDMTVFIREQSVGEGIASGGVPPTAIIEQV